MEGLYGMKMELVDGDGAGRQVYRVDCGEGNGTVTRYRLFPGIDLVFNNFRAADCMEHGVSERSFLELNHCRVGRYECEFEDGFRAYLGEGDFAVSTMETRQVASSFPLKRYYGLSVVADMEKAQGYFDASWPEMNIDLAAVREKFCGSHCYFGRAAGETRQFFEGLYREFPLEIQSQMYRLKTLELLQLLKVMTCREEKADTCYISREKSERIKQVGGRLEQEPGRRLTLSALAGEYDMSLSVLKAAFQAVYGVSPMAYRRRCRMRGAAELLRKTELSVSEVAGMVGYENSSKFSAAFRRAMGTAPVRYRKEHAGSGAKTGNAGSDAAKEATPDGEGTRPVRTEKK